MVEALLRDRFEREVFGAIESQLSEKLSAQEHAWEARKLAKKELDEQKESLRSAIAELEALLAREGGSAS